MGEKTSISWAQKSWSPWEGCTKISPGCDRCYAASMNSWLHHGENWGPGAPRRLYSDEHWRKPIMWNAQLAKRGETARVFPSVCDPFDNEAPEAERQRFWQLIADTPHLTWLLLTKRIGNVARMVPPAWLERGGWPRNVWLGATVVNQEPFLWGMHEAVDRICQNCPRDFDCECGYHTRAALKLPALHWVIVGGESGRGAREFSIDAARDIVQQCQRACVPVHVKQMGAQPVEADDNGGKRKVIFMAKAGRDVNQWPADLQVQEFPEV